MPFSHFGGFTTSRLHSMSVFTEHSAQFWHDFGIIMKFEAGSLYDARMDGFCGWSGDFRV